MIVGENRVSCRLQRDRKLGIPSRVLSNSLRNLHHSPRQIFRPPLVDQERD